MKILVTGAAGFIGAALSEKLLARGDEILGVDNCNDYYDPSLKFARLKRLEGKKGWSFIQLDIGDRASFQKAFDDFAPKRVVNLAAQAGVRYSLKNPYAYLNSNLVGFLNVLEACRHAKIEHLVYASSSSVYGGNKSVPFAVSHGADHPLSLYAATKRSNELMAHSYSSLYGLPMTGLRFFTVYGPWGRPDMALFVFTKAILEGKPIEVFNYGNHTRDFTYIDDIVEGVTRVLDKSATPDPAWDGKKPNPGTSFAPHRVYNIGNHSPVQLLDFIRAIEEATGKAASMKLLPMAPGDVPDTFADVEDLARDTGFRPGTPVREGIAKFVAWYRDYFKL